MRQEICFFFCRSFYIFNKHHINSYVITVHCAHFPLDLSSIFTVDLTKFV